MAPELEALFDSIMPLAEAKAAGRVSEEACAKTVAAAIVAFGLKFQDLKVEAAALRRRQAIVAGNRFLAEAAAKGARS